MDAPPNRFWAFVLTVLAVTALGLPIVYTIAVQETLDPFGSLVMWSTVCLALFSILTVLVSVVRHFVAPAVQGGRRRGQNGNL